MAYSYQTPETVHRSADEYLNLGKEQSAFNLLVDYMSGKKPRQWSVSMEKIMTMIIDLAIKFDKKALLREPFNNYRFATQNSNMSSFESVLVYFATAAEEKDKNLIALAKDKALDMEDLDNEEPEELFINALDADTKTEKTILRKALKGVWDTYRMILEIVCRNKKLEDLYAQICKKAFEFCKTYNRKTEFKRLCESLRGTLTSIIKSMVINPEYSKIPNAIDLTNSETNERQMLIRFELIEYAYHFQLWQEAIKILEDIHNIMMNRRAAVKPKILSDYFENLAKMFWKSEFYHYHAVAYFNHYTLIRTKQKNIKTEELEQKSCAFVLSVLSIPPLQNENLQSEDAKSRAIALLSSESTVPSKQELITYISKHNILDLCTEEVRELFYLIEDSKNMVSLTKNSESLIGKLKDSHPEFQKPLQSVIIYKLLALLSKLYTKLKIESFSRFLGSLDYSYCEKIIHTASAAEHIKVRIDHKRRLLIFQDDVEDMQSLSLKFVNFSEDLKDVIHSIDNKREEGREQKIVEDLRERARRFDESGRTALSVRQKLIEDLKKHERDTSRQARKDIEEERKQARAEAAPKVTEKEVQEAEARKKKTKRIEDNLRAYEESRKASLIKQLKAIKGFKVDKKKLEDLTDDELAQISLKKLEDLKEEWEVSEKKKEEAAIKNAFKRADFYERARREAHLDVLKNQWSQKTGEKEEILKVHKENFDKMLEFKNKLVKAAAFRKQHAENIMSVRNEVYEEKLEEFRERVIEEFKGKILTQAKESLQARKDAEEEERKKRDEEFQNQKLRLEEERSKQAQEGFRRSGVTATDMQRQEETKKDDKTGISRATAGDKPAPTSVFQRGTGVARREEEKPATTSFSRNTEFKKEEPATGEAQRPRFLNAKKEGEEKKNPFGDARPVTQATQPVSQPTQAAPAEDGGWRTTATTAPKKDAPPKFSRGPATGASTGASTGGAAPSKGFSRNADSNASGSTGGGWRK